MLFSALLHLDLYESLPNSQFIISQICAVHRAHESRIIFYSEKVALIDKSIITDVDKLGKNTHSKSFRPPPGAIPLRGTFRDNDKLINLSSICWKNSNEDTGIKNLQRLMLKILQIFIMTCYSALRMCMLCNKREICIMHLL